MANDYSYLNLDSRLMSKNSLSNRFPVVSGLEFESQYEIQTNRMKSSRINLDGIVKLSGGASGTADFSAGPALNLSTSITFSSPKVEKKTFGHPLVAIYQGTTLTAANQIYPIRGTSVTLGRYEVQGMYDLHAYDGTSDIWRALLIDTNGTSTQVITFDADWLYVDYVAQDTV